MTEQSYTAAQLEQAARAILIDHQYSILDIKEQYKHQIYEALIKLSPAFALSYIPEAERIPALCMEAYKRTPYALKYFPQKQITEDLCDDAVRRDGDCLAFIPEKYKTSDRCLTAIGNAGYEVLDHIPGKYKADETFMFEAITRDEYIPLKLDQSIWDKPKHFWIQATNKNPLSIVMVPKQYRDIHMSTIAVAMNPEALAYIPKDSWTKAMCETAIQSGLPSTWNFDYWDEIKGIPYGYNPSPVPNPVYEKAQRIVQGLEVTRQDKLWQEKRKERSHERAR